MKKTTKRKNPPLSETITGDLKTKIGDNTATYENIDIEKINVEQQVIRAKIDDDHTIELATSMARHGLLEPIVVIQNKNEYDLAAGLHRVVAAHRLGWTDIPAMVRKKIKDTPIKAIALTENIIRRNLSLAEECEAVYHLYEEEKLSTGQICGLLGKSRSWVEKRLSAPNMPYEVRENLFDGFISMTVAEELCTIEDIGIRNEVMHRSIYGKMSIAEVRHLKELYQEASNVYEAVQQGMEKNEEIKSEKASKKICDACGEPRNIPELQPVWVCKEGCNQEQLDSNLEGAKNSGGYEIV